MKGNICARALKFYGSDVAGGDFKLKVAIHIQQQSELLPYLLHFFYIKLQIQNQGQNTYKLMNIKLIETASMLKVFKRYSALDAIISHTTCNVS